MLESLPWRHGPLLELELALLDRGALGLLQKQEHRDGDHGQHEADSREGPSPVGSVETLGNLGSGESGDDVW